METLGPGFGLKPFRTGNCHANKRIFGPMKMTLFPHLPGEGWVPYFGTWNEKRPCRRGKFLGRGSDLQVCKFQSQLLFRVTL